MLLPEALTVIHSLLARLGIDVTGSYLTLDPGFDSAAKKQLIKTEGMVPVIKPNRRNEQNNRVIGARCGWHNRRRRGSLSIRKIVGGERGIPLQ